MQYFDFVVGLEGLGKSILFEWVYSRFKEFNNALIPVYCKNSRALRDILLNISGFLFNHFKKLKSIDRFENTKNIENLVNIRSLENIVFAYMVYGIFCIILDHVKDVKPRVNSFLTSFYEHALVITASMQRREIKDYVFNVNPKMIKSIFERLQNKKYFEDSVLKLKLILLNGQINKIKI